METDRGRGPELAVNLGMSDSWAQVSLGQGVVLCVVRGFSSTPSLCLLATAFLPMSVCEGGGNRGDGAKWSPDHLGIRVIASDSGLV